MAKRFTHQKSKTFHICKWISFAVSTFVIVEETPSGLLIKVIGQSRSSYIFATLQIQAALQNSLIRAVVASALASYLPGL